MPRKGDTLEVEVEDDGEVRQPATRIACTHMVHTPCICTLARTSLHTHKTQRAALLATPPRWHRVSPASGQSMWQIEWRRLGDHHTHTRTHARMHAHACLRAYIQVEWRRASVTKRAAATGEFSVIVCFPDGTPDPDFHETFRLEAEGREWRRA